MSELQKDLVLSLNEYAYVLDETKGNVSCNVGPHNMQLQRESLLAMLYLNLSEELLLKKFLTES